MSAADAGLDERIRETGDDPASFTLAVERKAVSGAGTFDNLVGCDDDWYALDVCEGGTLDVWMGYDTALSGTTFAIQQIAAALGQLVGWGAILALSFMVAESLGRRAFPHHVQLWRTWSGEVAPTKPLLGQTVAGYLLVAVFFAYEVWLNIFANSSLGWWTPSDALTDPNVLANYFPWLTSIAISLQAGFWEECLFRAVPLASAALLGRRFGKPWLWIAVAMLSSLGASGEAARRAAEQWRGGERACAKRLHR